MSATVRALLTTAISDALRANGIEPPAKIHLERPANPDHGDWATNAAMAGAKGAGRNPRELAAALRETILGSAAAAKAHVAEIDIAGPGFLNFRLANAWLHDLVREVLSLGEGGFGLPNVGGGRTVNVEYVSANPTGPLHAGHARWACYGDALSRVLDRAGFKVHKEFYVNDRGVQMQKFAASLLARQTNTPIPDGGYAGQYIIDWAAEMPAGLSEADALEWGYAKALKYQQDTMARINVTFDTFSSERALAARGDVEATLADLRAHDAIYVAIAPETTSDRDQSTKKGAVDEASESAGPATWLRTTSFLDPKKRKPFDDSDRVLIKGDGQYTYFMPDIAYHRDKFNRGSLLINILGADHHGYVGRMKAAIMALGHNPDDLEILIGQNCVLMRGDEIVKLSKRTGDIVELAEIIDEVGADVTKLTFLLQSIDTRQTVDLDAIIAQSLDNPVHYIQYAHARIHGIGRKAAELGVSRRPLDQVDLALLVHPCELELAAKLGDLDEVIALAALERAPHKLTTWIRELAATFQKMYNECPILRPDIDDELRQARLAIVEAARIGLSIGLSTLGVSAPEKMDSLTD